MKYALTLLIVCFFVASFADVPAYVDFQLELTYMYQYPPYTGLMGSLTITNNGTVSWEFQNQIGYLGYIRIDSQSAGGGLFVPFHIILAPQQQCTFDLQGEIENLGPGIHHAQAYLSYSIYSGEPVGNSIAFSMDDVLDEFSELEWEFVLNELGSDTIDASLVATNFSYYFWKRSMPVENQMQFGLDGDIPSLVQIPSYQSMIISPVSTKLFNSIYSHPVPFSPGHHSLQAYIMEEPPVPVGEPFTFYVQGSDISDEVASLPLSASIYPNPLNPNSVLRLDAKDNMRCDLQVFNIRGQKVIRVDALNLQKGSTDLPLNNWLPPNLADGVYIFRLSTPRSVIDIKGAVVR